jgi:hypothetical protein
MTLGACEASTGRLEPASRANHLAWALVQGSFDGWFWAECRACSWPGVCHRERSLAQAEADDHNSSVHCSSQPAPRSASRASTLESAFSEYRAGCYDRALASLRRVLIRRINESVRASWTRFDPDNELSTRALAFITEIAPRPTRRETAAALMMVGALVRD